MTTMNATVKDVMTAEVVAVRSETTFKEMAAALRRYRVSALPVVDDAGRVLGVVSEADLLAKEALADPGAVAELVHRKDVRKAEGLTAGDLMTREAVTASPDDPRSSRPPG
jgi:CBS domain-containing protein